MAGILKVDKYQDFNGNDIMTSDGSGNLTLNNAAMKMTPSFRALATDGTAYPSGAYTKFVFGTELWDTDSAFTNNEFTVPTNEAGKYWFNWRLKVSGIDDNEYHVSALYKNGSRLGSTGQKDYANGTDQQVITTGSVMLELAVGDVISVYGIHNEGAERTMFGGTTDASDASFLEGYKLIGA